VAMTPNDIARAIYHYHRSCEAIKEREPVATTSPYEMSYTHGALHQLRRFDADHPDWSDAKKNWFNNLARIIARFDGEDEVRGEHIDAAAEIAQGEHVYFCPDCRSMVITHNPGAFLCPASHTNEPMIEIAFPFSE